MSTKRKFHIPDDAEDAALTRAAEADQDNPPLTDAELAAMRPARRGRPALAASDRKVAVNVRYDQDVLEAFRATGEGWQTRMNDALRAYAKSHRMLPR